MRGSQLLVRLGSKMAAPSSGSVDLTLADTSAIVRLGSGGDSLAGRASGSVTVNFTQAMTVRSTGWSRGGSTRLLEISEEIAMSQNIGTHAIWKLNQWQKNR